MKPEFLGFATHELRMSKQDGRAIVGTIPYNSRSVDLGGFVEVIAPGAFDAALKADADVRFLWNHDSGSVLGRTPNTLTLHSDGAGLNFRCKLPDTQCARDLIELTARGDVRSVSFGFQKEQDRWEKDASGQLVGTLLKVSMSEISATSFPAYQAATAALRSCPPELLSSNALSESEDIRLFESNSRCYSAATTNTKEFIGSTQSAA